MGGRGGEGLSEYSQLLHTMETWLNSSRRDHLAQSRIITGKIHVHVLNRSTLDILILNS